MQTFVIAKVIIVNDDGEMLALTRDPNDVNRPGQPDFPGGNVEPGEELTSAAKRKTKEETGLVVEDLNLVYTTTAVNEKGSGSWLFFLARVQGSPDVRISHEHAAYAWMPVKEFVKQIVYPRHREVFDYLLAHQLL